MESVLGNFQQILHTEALASKGKQALRLDKETCKQVANNQENMSTGDKVKLVSSDNQVFEVDKLVAYKSHTLKLMIKNKEIPKIAIPLPNISSKILSKVIQYCKYYLQVEKWSDEEKPVLMKQWDDNFVNVDQYTLYGLMDAASYLIINPLLDLTCRTLADKIKFLSVQEMRTLFTILNDLTPQEEEEIRKDNQWAFE